MLIFAGFVEHREISEGSEAEYAGVDLKALARSD